MIKIIKTIISPIDEDSTPTAKGTKKQSKVLKQNVKQQSKSIAETNNGRSKKLSLLTTVSSNNNGGTPQIKPIIPNINLQAASGTPTTIGSPAAIVIS
jgi:hypothetical protein